MRPDPTRPADRRKLAVEIADSLREEIVAGRLIPGESLPSERDLAERWEVNRSSVREALLRLEAWGLVEIRHGGATRVRDFLVSAGLQVLPYLVELGGRVDRTLLADLHDMRGMLLGWCAERAAEVADPASVRRLLDLARKLADSKKKPADLQALDWEFFEELVRIGGNRVLGLFSNVVREVYARARDEFLPLYQRGVFDPGLHLAAVEAIRRRDPAAAGAAMRAHARNAWTTEGGRG